jgi:glucosamine-6-phosphate deaminase
MVVRRVRDYDELSVAAAQLIASRVRGKPHLVLGLAAGNSPVGTYRELVRMYREEALDFSQVVFFNLDEYEIESFTSFLKLNLLDQINAAKSNVHLLRFPADPEAVRYCQGIEQAIQDAGGIDLQILGIGSNGHIAFNEPGSGFDSRTRIVSLGDQGRAITLGLATILEARQILLLASGEPKANILRAAVDGPVTEFVPASVLQRHSDVTVIASR